MACRGLPSFIAVAGSVTRPPSPCPRCPKPSMPVPFRHCEGRVHSMLPSWLRPCLRSPATLAGFYFFILIDHAAHDIPFTQALGSFCVPWFRLWPSLGRLDVLWSRHPPFTRFPGRLGDRKWTEARRHHEMPQDTVWYRNRPVSGHDACCNDRRSSSTAATPAMSTPCARCRGQCRSVRTYLETRQS
ncbi:hypothetical protein B0T25DRAFT_337714 [Lasiosphaeria hispida]|uniref:Uncharacterized protein n=1 Tax=Lasiosphaeria hispida TaxID=260671 RepID=A0AAJ0M8E1_9PEZI|nr:hypothetical protein B0T25DRAFT_337714 [Lasiosphaeria hispida]